MKILCISDHVDPLVYSPSIKQRFADVELVLSAGDLPMSYYDFIMSTLNKPLLFVFGNHNLRYMPLFTGRADSVPRSRFSTHGYDGWLPTGAVHIGSRVRREKSVLVAGLGGSLWYNGGENQFREFQIALRIVKLLPRLLYNKLRFGRYLDILLTHAPPFGIHDREDRCHRGFKTFLWFMRVLRPKYLVHGHIHLYSASELRMSRYQQTTVVNAYDHVVIDVQTPGTEIPG
ncbi:MAG: metallophosphoesterase [Spirochaetales bacterium]|nr:metallophosphoesterase [Spirochaetales bacterium]